MIKIQKKAKVANKDDLCKITRLPSLRIDAQVWFKIVEEDEDKVEMLFPYNTIVMILISHRGIT